MADPTEMFDKPLQEARDVMHARKEEMDALSLRVANEVLEQPECGKWTLQSVGLSGPEFLKMADCEHDQAPGAGEIRCRPKGVTPAYATNLGACEEVLDHMRVQGITVRMESVGKNRWEVSMWVTGSPTWTTEVLQGPSLPELVCRTAVDYTTKEAT